MIFSRHWAMPSADTFSIQPIGAFVLRYMEAARVVVDPFARDNRHGADYSNDLNPNTASASHMDAVQFLESLNGQVQCDLLILDPPYSPRQISECYAGIGRTVTMQDTQSSFYTRIRAAAMPLLTQDATVLSFGWNSVGMGPDFVQEEIMLVCHGGAHNDTICLAERRIQGRLL